MQKIDGFWFPYRRYKPGKIVLQAGWLENIWPLVRRWNLAIDIGAYVGTVSVELSKKFRRVVSFEPLPDAYECLVKNTPKNVDTYNVACGNESSVRPYVRMNASGFAHFGAESIEKSEDKPEFCRMIRLDDLKLRPDFIKIDAEFTDEAVLKGARETIMTHHPVLMVEIKGRKEEMDGLLRDMHYSPVTGNKVNMIYDRD